MPAKTIYIKDSDMEMWERAKQNLGDSVSSLLSTHLRSLLDSVDSSTGDKPRDPVLSDVCKYFGGFHKVCQFVIDYHYLGKRIDGIVPPMLRGRITELEICQMVSPAHLQVYLQAVNQRSQP